MASYKDIQSFKDLLAQREGAQFARAGANRNYQIENTRDQGSARLGQAVEQFNSLFTQLVGRAPDNNEIDVFNKNILSQNYQVGAHESGTLADLRDPTTQFINDNFQKQAEQQVQQQLQGQQTEATRLAGFAREQGRTAISSVEQDLMNYQQKLFEKLRPNLITSLQTQGLLNTGGLSEAMAGAQKDLADEGSNYLRDQRLQNELAANQIEYGGQAAPYMFQQQQALNQVPWMQQQGMASLDRNFQSRQNELQFGRQLQLMQAQADAQRGSQPNFLKQFGGQLLGNALYGGASALGRNIQQSGGGQGGYPAAATAPKPYNFMGAA
jgi:hypothetical protein